MAGVKVVRHWARSSRPPAPGPAKQGEQAKVANAIDGRPRAQIVAIAASTGGPTALLTVLGELPPGFPAPILIVQHMSPGFVAGLAAWLDAGSALRVKIAEAGEELEPGVAYLAPEEHHIGLADRHTVRVSNSAPVGGFRPSGTFLFESVAGAY